jgi:hydrogenase maturation factor
MTYLESTGVCDGSTHCITCSDAVELLKLDSRGADRALGTCVDGQGNRSEVLLALVPEAEPGDWLLVHAGVALLPSTAPAELHQ